MSSSIERRLKRLEGLAKSGEDLEFIIEDDGDRSADERLRMLGILDKPGRKFLVTSVQIVHPGPQPEGGCPPDVSPFASGNWRYEPLYKEPRLCSFGPASGPRHDGSEWVMEF